MTTSNTHIHLHEKESMNITLTSIKETHVLSIGSDNTAVAIFTDDIEDLKKLIQKLVEYINLKED